MMYTRCHSDENMGCGCLFHQASTLQTDRSTDPELVMFTADLLDAATAIAFAGDIPQIVDLLHFSVDVLANSTSRSIPPSHEVHCMVMCLRLVAMTTWLL